MFPGNIDSALFLGGGTFLPKSFAEPTLCLPRFLAEACRTCAVQIHYISCASHAKCSFRCHSMFLLISALVIEFFPFYCDLCPGLTKTIRFGTCLRRKLAQPPWTAPSPWPSSPAPLPLAAALQPPRTQIQRSCPGTSASALPAPMCPATSHSPAT